MSKTNKAQAFAQAVKDATQVLRFEHWLRFNYLKEKDGKLVYGIPEESLARVREQYPNLQGLADIFNNEETDQERSTTTVCAFMAARLDGQAHPEGVISQVFDSPGFKIEMYLFSLWNQSHEGLLEQKELDFAEWERLYAEWRASEQVKAYEAKLVLSPGQKGTARTQ